MYSMWGPTSRSRAGSRLDHTSGGSTTCASRSTISGMVPTADSDWLSATASDCAIGILPPCRMSGGFCTVYRIRSSHGENTAVPLLPGPPTDRRSRDLGGGSGTPEGSRLAGMNVTPGALPSDGGQLYWDPFDKSLRVDPHPTWRRLRDEAPVYYNDRYDFWALSRFVDVDAGHRDPQTFSSAHGTVLEMMTDEVISGAGMMIFVDPPEHTRLRRLVSKTFTP